MNAMTALEVAEELPGAEPLTPAAARPAIQARRRRLGLGEPLALGPLLGPGLLLLFWCVLSYTGLLDPRILPSPWATLATARDLTLDGRLLPNLAVSAIRAAEGLAFGVVAGLAVALISGLSRLGGYVFDGLVQMKRSIPALALIPLLILWLGIGEPMKVTMIAIGVFIPIYMQTQAALRDTEVRYLELAETLRLSRWRFVRHVVLPGALPGFLLGLRFAVMGAWLALVVVLVVYALLGLTSNALVRLAEGRLLRWRRTMSP
jgi:sulfonate transport system permease protein